MFVLFVFCFVLFLILIYAGDIEVIKDCRGQQDLISTYKLTIQNRVLAGPTTFVPLIKEAIKRCSVCFDVCVCVCVHVCGVCGCA